MYYTLLSYLICKVYVLSLSLEALFQIGFEIMNKGNILILDLKILSYYYVISSD